MISEIKSKSNKREQDKRKETHEIDPKEKEHKTFHTYEFMKHLDFSLFFISTEIKNKKKKLGEPPAYSEEKKKKKNRQKFQFVSNKHAISLSNLV